MKNAYFYDSWRYFNIEEMSYVSIDHDFLTPLKIEILMEFMAKSVNVFIENFHVAGKRLNVNDKIFFANKFTNNISVDGIAITKIASIK